VNVAATLSVATAGIALGGAAAAWLVGRAQGWRALRWFSLLALCVAVYSVGNVATVLSAPDGVVLVASSRLVEAPYLMDVAALLPVGVLGWSHIVRFLEDAATLEWLRGRLEAQAEQRTRALSQTRAVLEVPEAIQLEETTSRHLLAAPPGAGGA
jgi:hypothetical protein